MNDNQDRLMDQIIEEAARKNGPPDLRAKIMAAANNKAAPSIVGSPASHGRAIPAARIRLLPIVITSIAALLVITVLANIDFVRELVTRANNGTGAASASSGLPANAPASSSNATNNPRPDETPKGTPENKQPGNSTEPAPKDGQPDQPKEPKPENPRKPDEVKKPEEKTPEEHKPDGVVEEPKKPEGTNPPDKVEKPEPKNDGTEVASPGPVVARYHHQGQKSYDMNIRYLKDGKLEEWREQHQGELYSGVQVRASCFVFTLENEAFLYLSGVISIALEDGALHIELKDESARGDKDFFIDNMGTGKPLKVSMGELSMDVREGAAMFSYTSSGLTVFCTDGQIDAESKAIIAGHTATLSKRGLSAIREMTKKQWDEPMLGNIPARVMHVETFDEEPAGGIYGGKIEDDILRCKGHGEYVAFRFNPTLKLLPRMAVRFLVRYSKATRLQLEMFEQGGNDQPWLIHLTPKQGEWVEVTVKFEDLRLREKPDARLAADTLLRNFKLYVEGEKDASLEIDWVEFVRLGPGE